VESEKIVKLLFAIAFLAFASAFIITGIFYVRESPKLPAKAELADDLLNITFYTNKNYANPAETSTFYFDIINKKNETIKKIDISVEISYLGNVVYRQQGASIRDFKQGQKVTIRTENSLPLLTPPGNYLVQLTFKPENSSERYLEYYLYVKPSIYQLIFLFLMAFLFCLLTFYFDAAKEKSASLLSLTKKNFGEFTVGERLIFMGIICLVITAFILASGLRSVANEFASLAYLLLVIGVMGSLLEYLSLESPEMDNILILLTLSIAAFFLTNNGINEYTGKTITSFALAWAVLSFSTMEKTQQKRLVGYLVFYLFLWTVFNLYQKSMPYYSIGLIAAFLLYLTGKRRVNH
jgi:hypothetical protein